MPDCSPTTFNSPPASLDTSPNSTPHSLARSSIPKVISVEDSDPALLNLPVLSLWAPSPPLAPSSLESLISSTQPLPRVIPLPHVMVGDADLGLGAIRGREPTSKFPSARDINDDDDDGFPPGDDELLPSPNLPLAPPSPACTSPPPLSPKYATPAPPDTQSLMAPITSSLGGSGSRNEDRGGGCAFEGGFSATKTARPELPAAVAESGGCVPFTAAGWWADCVPLAAGLVGLLVVGAALLCDLLPPP